MNKLIYLMSLGLLVNIGCSKEQSQDPKQGAEIQQESIYVYNMFGETPGWELIPADAMQASSEQNSAVKSNSNSAHTHGNIEGFVTFSGTQNNGGTHGSAEILTPALHLMMETVSVVLIGEDQNQAVYGGLITEVISNTIPPPPFGSIPLCRQYIEGNYLYFSVIDNGQGNNAEPDQFSLWTFVECEELEDGGASKNWAFIFGYWPVNSETNDKVKVNN
jgi:hypothetical protein